MDVTELVALTEWIEREIKGKRIPKLYAGLTNVLQNNVASQPVQPFAEQLKNLLTAISEVDLAELNIQQLEFLGEIGVRQAIGKSAVDRIEEILYRNSLDIATANQLVREIAEQLQAGISRSDQIRASLSGVPISRRDDLKGQVLVRITFQAEASIENIVDLKKWSNEWHDIGRGLAFATNVRPEDLRIVGAQTGSIILELAVAYGVAKVINKVILDCLAVADKVLELIKKSEEIKGMKLKNRQILIEMDKEAVQMRTDAISEIAAKAPALMEPGSDGEKQIIVEKAVKKLIQFLEKGGRVDCVVPQLSSEDANAPERDEIKELREQARQIRILEKDRALLGYLSDVDEGRRHDDTD